MFCMRRALGAVFCLALAFPACAFTFSYGDLFTVKEITNKSGVVQMPLSRKKYKDVKVLSKKLYRFLRECSADCRYSASTAQLKTAAYRPAATRADMWIADVSVNEELLLTVLVFKNKSGVSVKFPEVVQFTDTVFKKNLQEYVGQVAAEHL